MTQTDFRLDVFNGPDPSAVYRMTMPDEGMWISLHDGAAAGLAESPAAVRSVTGRVIGDDAQQDVTGATVVSAIWYDVPADATDDFESWFSNEHAPMLLNEPKWLRCRRVRIQSDTSERGLTHLVVHELLDTEALSSPHLAAARETPARAEMASKPWFANNVMQLFQR